MKHSTMKNELGGEGTEIPFNTNFHLYMETDLTSLFTCKAGIAAHGPVTATSWSPVVDRCVSGLTTLLWRQLTSDVERQPDVCIPVCIDRRTSVSVNKVKPVSTLGVYRFTQYCCISSVDLVWLR